MKRIKKLPYPIKILTHGARLPSYISFFEAKNIQHDQMLSDLKHQVGELQGDLEKANTILAAYKKMDDKITDIYHQISVSSQGNEVARPVVAVVNSTVSDDHHFDQFYKAFEDKFRGSEELIKTRLLDYVPLFKGLPKSLQKKPVVDIGCGRGELLAVLKESNFNAVGIDMNESMVSRAVEAGFEAYNTDALSYLATLKTSSLSSVTGFHIVEHIPFEPLMAIFKECYRSIDRGGFALFETPNPETSSVG
ncbi:MAG: class I SAM-dependent methyltransferase [Candidatus Saccharimonas sp.]